MLNIPIPDTDEMSGEVLILRASSRLRPADAVLLDKENSPPVPRPGNGMTQLQLQSRRSEAALTSANLATSRSSRALIRALGRPTFDTGLTPVLIEEVFDVGSRS